MNAPQKLVASDAMPDFAMARYHMIESQLRPNTVRNELILGAMGSLPREMFVPDNLKGIAYIDEDIQVAPNRYLLEPMVLARLLQEADIKLTDRVLDIAPATGYSTALMASIASHVVAVEADTELKVHTEQNLRQLDLTNFTVRSGAFADGANGPGPYDLVLINGGIDAVPEMLLAQLAEGGRLAAVVRRYGPGHAAHLSEARLYVKLRGHISHRALFDANVKLLPGMQAVAGFIF
jgi:protein-L-isoaspartate(D-aspartate) O-methyltransferase